MTRTEAQKRARAKYTADKVKRVEIRFYPSEADMWARIEGIENKSGYVKNLIRADMERGGGEGAAE